MGEGAGVVVLERLDDALDRGARVYAEIIGYGNTADAFHFTAPEPNGDGMIRVMEAALQDADTMVQDIDYINAHGTSTLLNDKIESAAIGTLFGEHAKNLTASLSPRVRDTVKEKRSSRVLAVADDVAAEEGRCLCFECGDGDGR